MDFAKISVSKRLSGKTEPYQRDKLVKSILKCLKGVSEAERISIEIASEIEREIKEGTVDVDRIAGWIEKSLMERAVLNPEFESAAKRFVLARIYNQVYGKNRWERFDENDLRLSYNALRILESRYLLRDPETRRIIETPKGMFTRVARHVAKADSRYGLDPSVSEKKFLSLMLNLEFLPNSPTLMNAGTVNGVLSACYVIPVRDSLTTNRGDGIIDAIKAQALLQKQGSGTGFDFSELRPKGDTVKSSGGVSSGPVSFMMLFDTVTEVIKFGGKRRGANMGVLHAWHADIREFISLKTGARKEIVIQNFNISVGVNDAFMKALEEDREYPLINPRKTWLRNTIEQDSKYYATTLARHSIHEEWVQEEILKELEENEWSIPLHESRIVTWEEAVAIAENEGAIVEHVKARELWNNIVAAAWESGDPGLLYIDTINRRHPAWYLGKINACNPCIAGDTLVLTPEGWKTAREIYEEAKRNGAVIKAVMVNGGVIGEGGEPLAYETKLVVPQGETPVCRAVHGRELKLKIALPVEAWVWHVGKKRGLRIITREGYEIIVTPEHKFLTPQGWREAEKLRPGDEVAVARMHPHYIEKALTMTTSLDEDIAFALGWLVGKGFLDKQNVMWRFNSRDEQALERVKQAVTKLGGNPEDHLTVLGEERVLRFNNNTIVYKRITGLVGQTLPALTKRRLPKIVWRLNLRSLAAFLRGLFTANGTIDVDGTVRLTSASRWLLVEVLTLLTALGMTGAVCERQVTCKQEPCYTSANNEENNRGKTGYYELIIGGYSKKLFHELIAFESSNKLPRLEPWKTITDVEWATVERVEDAGLVDFYDFTVPGVNTYVAAGLVHHNCGEQPLLEWESCNLGSINLEKFVHGAQVDWQRLARTVRIAVRFLDNVIDMNRHPLRQLGEANLRTRKIGLGVMGWARMLARLGIPYDDPEAVYLGYKLAEWIEYHAALESINLAKERGTFPACNKELYKPTWRTAPSIEELSEKAGVNLTPPKNITIPRIDWSLVEEGFEEYGLRNACLTSIAPTGTISIIAGTSSGIEPFFALAFVRVLSVGSFIEVDRVFLQELARRKLLNKEIISKVAETGSVASVKEVPDDIKRVFKTAHEINPLWHLLHQAVWQAWVDAGVSKTVNIRRDEPPETIEWIFKKAWELGIKGVTVYREGSRESQVIVRGIKEPPHVPRDSRLRRKKIRIGSKELVAATEDYAGGCPSCEL